MLRSGSNSWPSASSTLDALGRELWSPFPVKRHIAASVLWINDGWFINSGVAVHKPQVRAHVSRWLLETFAVGVPSEAEPRGNYLDHTQFLNADRYGGTSGALHGGSGRCGASGAFNVKGVGRTPLAAQNADWYHSHGCVWLEEAIREAICSEVAWAELPQRAVRTVAIIDTGTRIYWPDGSTGERRALLVRPNFVRLAHLQRSIHFGSSGHPDSDQVKDAKRVCEAIKAVWGPHHNRSSLRLKSASLVETAARLGQQLGHSRASRLWPGPFISSNVTIDGTLVDFGSFRAMPNWRRAYGARQDPSFGEEERSVIAALKDVSFYDAKYNGNFHDNAELVKSFENAVGTAFDTQIQAYLGDTRNSLDVLGSLKSIYERQQRTRISADSKYRRDDLLYQVSTNNDRCIIVDRHITQAINGSYGAQIYSGITRLLRSRPYLYRERLLSKIRRLERYIYNSEPHIRPQQVGQFISRIVGRSRRHFNNVPDNHIVVAHASCSHSYYAVLLDVIRNDLVVMCCGAPIGVQVVFFDHEIEMTEIDSILHSDDDGLHFFTKQYSTTDNSVMIGSKSYRLPAPDIKWVSA